MALIPALLPWQAPSWARLCQALAQGRLAHGLLLHGPAGVGKRALAQAFAERLMCAEAEGEALACGRCKPCQLMAAGTHPDFVAVAPEEGKKQIAVGQVRELRERLAQTAQQGRWRVALIAPAEAMNVNAANALLKTLEEPGADTVLLLVTARPQAVATTVRSRCQQLAEAVPPHGVAVRWLAAQGLDAGEAVQVLALSPAPLKALELARSGALAERREFEALLLELAEGRLDPIATAARVATERLGELLAGFQRLLIERARACIGEGRTPSAAELRFAERVGEAKGLLQSSSNINALLLLESLFVAWFELHAKLRHSK